MPATGADQRLDHAAAPGLVRFVSFPSSDLAFARIVRATILRTHPLTARDLEVALRRTHPVAVVRLRDLSDEAHPIWYVYRDGSALGRWAVGRWWETATDVARLRIDGGGSFVEVDAEAEALLGVAAEALIGRPYTELALEDDAPALELMWEALAEVGSLDSVYTIRRPDGRALTVEGHGDLTPDGVVVHLRRVHLSRTDG